MHKIRVSISDVFKYNKTEPYFFKYVSPILNIGFLQNFSMPAKTNLAKLVKYLHMNAQKYLFPS